MQLFRPMWEEAVNEQFYIDYPHLRPDPEAERRKVQERLAQKPQVLLQAAYEMVRGQTGQQMMPRGTWTSPDENEFSVSKNEARFFETDKSGEFATFDGLHLKTTTKNHEFLDILTNNDMLNTKHAYRKIKGKTTVVNPMDAEKYARLKTYLQSKNVIVMQAVGDDLAYLIAIGAEATYDAGYIMHIGEIPSASAFFEEVIHWAQAKKYGELTSSDPVELCAREVAANRKLLHNGNAYGFDEIDFNDIQRNLARWETKFEELVGTTYDESDYRRDI